MNDMKQRIGYLLGLFAALVGVFALQKPLFMVYNDASSGEDAGNAGDFLQVMGHGLSLDMTMAGYLTALPLLLLLVSVWVKRMRLRRWLLPYLIIIAFLMATVFVVDTTLYDFWRFKLDATVFTYLDAPGEALASVSAGFVAVRVLLILVLTVLLAWALAKLTPVCLMQVRKRVIGTIVLLLMGGGLFVIIRGGVTESTANIGQVYFSDNQFLNHSAVNPCFSLLSSMGKSKRFEEMYDFFPEAERAALFEGLFPPAGDSTAVSLLRTDRPNILLILLEGFGAEFVETLGGAKGASPNLDRLGKEGVWFTHYYNNSFRTDRGTVCALSGYPGLPQTSVMKIPAKSRTLPGIAGSLKAAGYATDFLYGGDINFTNMKSYLLGTGYQRLTADTDFTLQERTSNAWGVNDNITFDYLLRVLTERTDTASRWMTTFLTLSSHEPFEVPFSRFPHDKRLNSFAYTDDCLGKFIDRLKELPLWDNLLVICLPDHGIAYPEGGITEHTDPRMFHAPMLWTGGAVKQPLTVERLMNQTDLAATLLGQLGLPAEEYPFSRNVFGKNYTYPFAFYTFNDGLAFRDSTGITVYSHEADRVVTDDPTPSDDRLRKGKALLQTVFDDLGRR